MICKKVIRTIITLILSVIFVFSSILQAKAETMTWEYNYYHVSNSIRATCSGYREINANYYVYNDPTNKKYRMVIEVDFGTDAVTGSFTLGLAQIARGDVILCQGCTMTSNLSSTSVSFSVSGVNYCKIEVFSASAERGLTSFTGSWSRYTSQELTSINQIKGYVDGIETSLSDINSSLTSIAGYVDQVESLLTTINNSINALAPYVDNVESSLNTIAANQLYYSRPVWQYSIMAWALTYSDISIVAGMPSFTYYTSYNDGLFTPSHAFRVQPNSTVQLFIGSYYSIGAHNTGLYYNTDGTGVTRTFTTYADGSNSNYYYNIITVTNDSSSLVSVDIEFTANRTLYLYYLGNDQNIPDEVSMHYGIDFKNTYTRLLSSTNDGLTTINNTLNGMKSQSITNTNNIITEIRKVVSAIGEISQQQITENNTNINNYNDYQTQINNVENNYYTEFNTHESTIENNNTFNFDGLSSDGVTVYHNLFNNVYSISLIRWPLLIILLGLVIVIILG